MKLEQAVFQVKLGINFRDLQSDNWSSRNVMALNAIQAIKAIKLERGEYVVEVHLLHRLG